MKEIENLKTNRVPVVLAAKAMGVTRDFIHLGLQQDRLPFGTAVKFEKRWSYYINKAQFLNYLSGNINMSER